MKWTRRKNFTMNANKNREFFTLFKFFSDHWVKWWNFPPFFRLKANKQLELLDVESSIYTIGKKWFLIWNEIEKECKFKNPHSCPDFISINAKTVHCRTFPDNHRYFSHALCNISGQYSNNVSLQLTIDYRHWSTCNYECNSLPVLKLQAVSISVCKLVLQIKGQQWRTEQAPFDVDGFNRPRGRLRGQTRRKELREILPKRQTIIF